MVIDMILTFRYIYIYIGINLDKLMFMINKRVSQYLKRFTDNNNIL